jgi:glycosyltransferase involved in cell wall biosynthesis
MSDGPIVSVLTAAFRVPHLLDRALHSLLVQTDPHWEMVIAPDDGADYNILAQRDARVRIAHSGVVASGPGPARNRALAQARGQLIAVLDDDDALAPNFIEQVRAALAVQDAVIVPTAYVNEDGVAVREIGSTVTNMDIALMSRQFGSMHVATRRAAAQPWQACFAEDVVHSCRAIDRAGGHIAVLRDTRYINFLREGSSCTLRSDIDAEYARLETGEFAGMSAQGVAATRALFQVRRGVNRDFEARPDRAQGYHQFVQALVLPR